MIIKLKSRNQKLNGNKSSGPGDKLNNLSPDDVIAFTKTQKINKTLSDQITLKSGKSSTDAAASAQTRANTSAAAAEEARVPDPDGTFEDAFDNPLGEDGEDFSIFDV